MTTTALLGATVGAPYPNSPLSESGGVGPFTWTVRSGSLPTGLWLDSSAGVIRGTPTTAGTYQFTVGVTDNEPTPASASAALSIVVAPAATTTSMSTSSSSIVVGQSATYTATVSSPIAPTGTVSFSDHSSPITACQAIAITKSGQGKYQAACTVSYQNAGTHTVTATYSGDRSTLPSSSPAATVVVIAVSSPKITSSSITTTTVGETLRFTVTATGSGYFETLLILTVWAAPPESTCEDSPRLR